MPEKTENIESVKSLVGVRPRTYIIGLLCVAAIVFIVGYSELVASRYGSIQAVLLGASHMPPSAMGVLIVILFGNSILRKVNPALKLLPSELAIIYFMMVCAALLSSFGLVCSLLPSLVGINYFANASNNWRERFFPYIKSWLVPWDPSGAEKQAVVKGFYEGLHFGEAFPWQEWVVPLVMWTIFAFLFFFLSACVATLVRRQWVDNEKLPFPLVQLPMEMISNQPGSRFIQNKLMWIGAAIPFALHTINGLHNIVPSVPEIKIYWILNQYLVNKPWSDMFYLPLTISVSMIGFSYLLPLDVSFSMWFFFLLTRLQDVVGSSIGYTFIMMPAYPTREYIGFQSVGAFVAIVLSMLWIGRFYWRQVFRKIFNRPSEIDDSNEFMSLRFAFFGGLAALASMIAWLSAAGVSPVVAAFMLVGFVFVVVLVLSRAVSEVGLLMLQPQFRPIDLWAVFNTRASLGVENLAPLALLNGVLIRDPRTLMPSFLDAMKAADIVGAKRRSFGLGIGLAILAGTVLAYLFHLKLIYTHGGLNLNTWFMYSNAKLYFEEAVKILDGPKKFDIIGPGWFSVGMAFTFFLFAMRTRFWWWPFHPIGYALGGTWPSVVFWTSFLIGWALKGSILRYTGVKGYRLFRPFFLGLILGEFAAAIFWAIISALLGISSPTIVIS